MNISTIAIVNTDIRNFDTKVLEALKARYKVINIDQTDVNRHQVVCFSDKAPQSWLIRRLGWEGITYRVPHADNVGKKLPDAKFHQANKLSYVFTGNTNTRLTWDYINDLKKANAESTYTSTVEQVAKDTNTHLHQWLHQLYAYRPDLRAVTKFDELILICEGILEADNHDVDSQSYGYTDKLSNYTCTDANNQYLQLGETTCHTESRCKLELTHTALDTIINATQVLAYQALGIEDDITLEREREELDYQAYLNDIDEACNSRHLELYLASVQ